MTIAQKLGTFGKSIFPQFDQPKRYPRPKTLEISTKFACLVKQLQVTPMI